MHHYACVKNLPYLHEDIKQMIAGCSVCCEIKPRFYKTLQGTLIQSSQPFERLSINFKGPFPSPTKYHFLLMVVDKFSRFSFAFPCSDTSSQTVISRLTTLCGLFGFPAVVHSDNAKCFVSRDVKQFFNERGIATAFSSVYNPRGISQCEQYNRVI